MEYRILAPFPFWQFLFFIQSNTAKMQWNCIQQNGVLNFCAQKSVSSKNSGFYCDEFWAVVSGLCNSMQPIVCCKVQLWLTVFLWYTYSHLRRKWTFTVLLWRPRPRADGGLDVDCLDLMIAVLGVEINGSFLIERRATRSCNKYWVDGHEQHRTDGSRELNSAALSFLGMSSQLPINCQQFVGCSGFFIVLSPLCHILQILLDISTAGPNVKDAVS